MTCRKCESRINTGTKCFQCGYDVSKGPLENSKPKNKRSPALYGVVGLFITMSILMLLANIGGLLRIPELYLMPVWITVMTGVSTSIFYIGIPFMPYTVNCIVGIAVAVYQIILCIGILRLNKRAFNIYIGLLAGQGVLQIISIFRFLLFSPVSGFNILFPYILKGVLLAVIYKIDGKHFGGGKISEPVSVIRARQRREREGGQLNVE